MTFKKKALLPAIAMVLVSIVALSGVSYAWFTTSTSAKVTELALDVKVADGMQISVDGASWKSTLTSADIVSDLSGYTSNTNQIPTNEIEPVSSPCTVVNGTIPMFHGVIEEGALNTTALSDIKGSNGNYYAFDLFFNMSAEKYLVLDSGSYVKAEGTAETHKAARVAFVNLGSATTGSAAQALKPSDAEIFVWEPAALFHTASAKAADTAVVEGEKVAYKGVNAAATGFTGGTDVATTFITETEGKTNAPTNILKLDQGINKVRVYIWLEGQDVDCLNDISGNQFFSYFNFTQADVA